MCWSLWHLYLTLIFVWIDWFPSFLYLTFSFSCCRTYMKQSQQNSCCALYTLVVILTLNLSLRARDKTKTSFLFYQRTQILPAVLFYLFLWTYCKTFTYCLLTLRIFICSTRNTYRTVEKHSSISLYWECFVLPIKLNKGEKKS